MRGKVAKGIRRISESFTQGKPQTAYVKAGDGSIRLHPECTRALYKALKHDYKKEAHR